SDRGRVYWGGAVFALLADLGVRRATGGRRSLDDGLRAVLRKGGNATALWSVDAFLRTIDEATGTSVTRDLWGRAAAGSGRTSCGRTPPQGELALVGGCPGAGAGALAELFADLGVSKQHGTIALVDDAPLSAFRRAIARESLASQDGGERPSLTTGRLAP